MNVELRHLRALAAIGDEGSITGAAAVLGISQPALSRTLDQLEHRVGTRLVERTTRRLAFTAEGERLKERAHRILGELDDALAEAAGSTRPLRIGFAWAALGEHTVDLLRGWRQDHPRTPVEVHHLADPYTALLHGSVDAVFLRALPERTAPDLAVLPLYTEPRVAAVSRDDPLAARPEVALRDLAGRTVVLCATAATTSSALWPAAAARRPPGSSPTWTSGSPPSPPARPSASPRRPPATAIPFPRCATSRSPTPGPSRFTSWRPPSPATPPPRHSARMSATCFPPPGPRCPLSAGRVSEPEQVAPSPGIRRLALWVSFTGQANQAGGHGAWGRALRSRVLRRQPAEPVRSVHPPREFPPDGLADRMKMTRRSPADL